MTETAQLPVTLSERAARRIRKVLASEGVDARLRVAVDGGGCSGFRYTFEIARDRAADDCEIVRDGAGVLIDPVSLEFLSGAEIDFVDGLIGQSFQVRNPNATASCGCGTSFSV